MWFSADLPPAGVTFTSCSSTEGSCTISGGGASLNLATLANGDAVTITIQATLSATVTDGTTLANTPSVTSSTPDPDTSNNSGSAGSASITVQNKSDLLVTTQSNVIADKVWGDSDLHSDCDEPGPIPGVGGHFGRSSS